MMRPIKRRLLVTSVVALAMLQTASPAAAQQYSYSIEATSLSQALRQYGKASARQLIFTEDLVRGKRAPALKGNYSADEALARILAGSGLAAQSTASGAIMIVPVQESAPGEGNAGNAAADTGSVEEQQGVAEILVLGQRSLNADIRRTENDAQPYVVVNRETIERSGASTVEELLRNSLAMEMTSRPNSQRFDTGGAGSSINLRGLGADETLILVDGRRIPSRNILGNAEQPDISGIPVLAIERIEVLPSTASGIYGGGATGGVINIILKRDYRGADLRARYGDSVDGGARTWRLDATGGFNLNGGDTKVMLSGSYQHVTPVLFKDREVLQRYRRHILDNDPSILLDEIVPPLGSTTNILSVSGAPLTLRPEYGGGSLGSVRTFVPIGYAGPASDNGAGLIANAGNYNFELADTGQSFGGGRRALVTGSEIISGNFNATHRFSPSFDVFVDVSASRSESSFPGSNAPGFYFLSATDPGNPFNEDIYTFTPVYGADRTVKSRVFDLRVLGGTRFSLPFEWRAAVDLTWGHQRFRNQVDQGLTGLEALDVSSGLIPIFEDLAGRDDLFAPFRGDLAIHGPATSRSLTGAARLSGPLPLTLPGGKATANLLLEARNEKLDDFVSNFPGFVQVFPERSRRVRSIYGEVQLPLVSEENAVSGITLLELQVAARSDWYDLETSQRVFDPEAEAEQSRRRFNSVNPTLGLRYKPVPDLMLRASFATGFLPPSLTQLSPDAATPLPLGLFGHVDPERGNEPLGVVLVAGGGTADLRPERSKSWSAGVVFNPAFLPEARLSVDWTRISKRDAIAFPFSLFDPALLELLELFDPERIVRDTDPATFGAFPVGPIRFIANGAANVARAHISALDFTASYRPRTALGNFDLTVRATRELKRDEQLTPLVERTDLSGFRVPRWRGNSSLSWERSRFAATLNSRYVGPYAIPDVVALAQGNGGKVKSQFYHDIYLRYRVTEAGGNWPAIEVEGGVRNLFNTKPPVDTESIYAAFGEPIGAQYYVGLKTSF